MQQLALDLKLADFALFDTFHAGGNEPVFAAVKQAATTSGQQVAWIWGGAGSGRSHLLQAAVAAASAADEACAWLPLDDAGLQPGMLEGMGSLDLLCVDDVDRVAGQADWESALFRVFEDLRNNNGRLLVTASAPPADVQFSLRDLASRLASGPTWRLQPMSDGDLLVALQLRSRWRGLELPDEVGAFLLRRVERTPTAMFRLLDRLDEAALAGKRRLTVPLVREVLGLT